MLFILFQTIHKQHTMFVFALYTLLPKLTMKTKLVVYDVSNDNVLSNYDISGGLNQILIMLTSSRFAFPYFPGRVVARLTKSVRLPINVDILLGFGVTRTCVAKRKYLILTTKPAN